MVDVVLAALERVMALAIVESLPTAPALSPRFQ
jgi:hypothetical protein